MAKGRSALASGRPDLHPFAAGGVGVVPDGMSGRR